MFSYRHAFHAGNHADVLKHTTLLAMLRHMALKDTAFTVFDTHAGAGLYRLDGDYASTSGEAGEGYLRLIEKLANITPTPALQDYLDMVASFNTPDSHKVYPGSPFIIQRLLRERDKLKLFEIHPTDTKTLSSNIAQLDVGRQVAVLREDGFEGIKKFLPPPSRRALVLCDPSYEIKNDYNRVVDMVADALIRFSTGTYAIWYPIIPRPEAHQLLLTNDEGDVIRPGLPASGMFVINPPHTLKSALKESLKQVAQVLAQDQNNAFEVESGT